MHEEPDTIFHYTDAAGFIGITKSKKLWASCIECLNDEREFRHGLDLAGQIAKTFNRPEIPDATARIESFIEVMSRLWGMGIFSCSFSARRDLLSQWRGYCGAGNGYNIGLDVKMLQEACRTQGFSLQRCLYDIEEQKDLLRPWIKKMFDGEYDNYGLPNEKDRIDKAAEQTAYAVRTFVPLLKDASFSEEEEWRLIGNVNSHEDPRWKARPGKTLLIPYVEIDLSQDPKIFSTVTIGPGPFSREKLNFITLQQLLNSGIKAGNVQTSTVPYRYW